MRRARGDVQFRGQALLVAPAASAKAPYLLGTDSNYFRESFVESRGGEEMRG